MSKPLIALEIHDVGLWEPLRVLPVVDVMRSWGYNALVLHQNDLLDAVTHLGHTANYGVSDLRLKKVRNRAAWLNALTERLATFGAELFLEIKEPSFEDYALELFPGLLGAGGRPDPTKPEWPHFCTAKTRDLLERAPNIGGLIVNLSSPESRVSMPDHKSESGSSFDEAVWFDAMVAAFQEPLAAAGKRLYIRDFSYTADLQSQVLSAITCAGDGVAASVKVTAHDYFPQYPENPVAKTLACEKIIEFEAFGEHTGWGVIPNCRVGEFRERMHGYRAMGANGLLMRTSWEAINGTNALDTLSAVNIYALPRLVSQDHDARALILDWLHESFHLPGAAADEAAALMLESWAIPAAAYWNGAVFPRHSCLPSTWQEGWISMETNGMGRRDRELHLAPADPRLTEEARQKLFRDKETATMLATELAQRALAIKPDLPGDLRHLFAAFDWLPLFAKQFELATKATFYAARNGESDAAQRDSLKQDLFSLADELEAQWNLRPAEPHHHHVLLDPEQVRRFARSLPE